MYKSTNQTAIFLHCNGILKCTEENRCWWIEQFHFWWQTFAIDCKLDEFIIDIWNWATSISIWCCRRNNVVLKRNHHIWIFDFWMEFGVFGLCLNNVGVALKLLCMCFWFLHSIVFAGKPYCVHIHIHISTYSKHPKSNVSNRVRYIVNRTIVWWQWFFASAMSALSFPTFSRLIHGNRNFVI